MRILIRILITLLVALGMIVAQQTGAADISFEDLFPHAPVEMPEDSCFSIEFLDVGEGDSALVDCDGHYMLIDGGGSDRSSFIYTKLKDNGIDHLDYIVATHPDADHVGGLAASLNYASVDVAFCSCETRDTRAFNSFVKYLDKQGKKITVPDAGDSFDLGSAEVTVLGPEKGQSYSDNTSIVLRITYGNTSFLFTGDSEMEDEKSLLSSGRKLKSDLIKVAHHGSRSSSSQVFLDAVKPDFAVISVGKDNSYGHPAAEVLDRLEKLGAEIYRTDLSGTIRCISDGNTITFD